jgi:hypothetical protein
MEDGEQPLPLTGQCHSVCVYTIEHLVHHRCQLQGVTGDDGSSAGAGGDGDTKGDMMMMKS